MSVDTYWTVVPLVGTAFFGAIWLWLRLTRPKHPKPGE